MKHKSIINGILCAIGWNTPETSNHNQQPNQPMPSSFEVKYDDINHISNSNINHNQHNAKYFLDKEIQNIQNQNKAFKQLAILAMVCSIALTAGLIYVGLQSKVTPYLLVLDNQGRELNAVQVKKDINPSQLESIRTAYMMDVILSFRTVTPDSLIQKRFVNNLNTG